MVTSNKRELIYNSEGILIDTKPYIINESESESESESGNDNKNSSGAACETAAL
jgi:hypothetical protein